MTELQTSAAELPGQTWRSPPPVAPIGSEAIHVWGISLAEWQAHAGALSALLSVDEQRRQTQFRFEHDRRRFGIARGLLRILLSRSLHIAPSAISFECNPSGKPFLSGAPLHFNLSHSGDLVLIAITSAAAIGIDIEEIRPGLDCLPIAQRFFSESEYQELNALPAPQQQDLFYRFWTGKEALIKAAGASIGQALQTCRLSFASGSPQVIGVPQGAPEQWAFWELPAPPHCKAALALQAQPMPLFLWRLDPADFLQGTLALLFHDK